MQFILDNVADNVDWQLLGPASIPQAGPHQGKAGVGKFFAAVAQAYEITQFEPREFVAQNNSVFVVVDYSGKAKKTGKPYKVQVAMHFAFTDGKVTKFREYVDTVALAAALS